LKCRYPRSRILVFTILLCFLPCLFHPVASASYMESASAAPKNAETQAEETKRIFAERQELFEKVSLTTGIPWYYLAAIDQYERSIRVITKTPAQPNRLGINIPAADWTGPLNPNLNDSNPISIAWFGGLGRDGSGDGVADRSNDLDLLAAVITKVAKFGLSFDDFQIGLWNYYQNSRSVTRISQFAQIYERFGILDLHEHAFPLPVTSNHSYQSTWGARRGWGGYRIHEGTDIFAGYGVPVRSTCFGMIEIIGWNPYGGWRVGIRDLNGLYHYYAHLSGFNKKIDEGDIVKPGQVIGWVGSSGYGKPGTSGKFPPHLHYGLYRDHGLSEWSFDPYPYLRKWEREDRARQRNKRSR
jgi:murein DD-endopeptidase MepM/ murein hydrolase activator NlpD